MYSKCTVMLAEKMYFNFLYAVVKVTQHMSLHNELSTRFCHIHAGQVYTYRKNVHCPKNALYLSIKTEPVTAGARMQRDMPGFCFNIPVPLHLLLTWQARFLWGGSDYFWDSVYSFGKTKDITIYSYLIVSLSVLGLNDYYCIPLPRRHWRGRKGRKWFI